MGSHDSSHGSLKRRPAEKSYCCWGCKEIVFAKQPSYHCDQPRCGFRIHEECKECEDTQSIWLQLVNCTFTFQKEPFLEEPSRGKKMGCEACGEDVNGWCFVGDLRKRRCYLHPCCARLDFKRMVQDKDRRVVLELKEKASSVCLICGNEGHSKDFKSWVYVSRCRKYCYHVSCMKQNVEEWTKDRGSSRQQQIAHEAGTSSRAPARPAPSQEMKPGAGEDVLESFGMAAEILNVVVCLIFGIPPLPISLVIKCIRKMW